MNIFDKLKALSPTIAASSAAEWHATQHPTLNRSRPAITSSPELTRVCAIPRRDPVQLDQADHYVDLMTERLRKTVSRCDCVARWGGCLDRLKPAQAVALYEAPLANGLLAPVGVGHGKTILDLLIPIVMRSQRAVLLIPPNLRAQLIREYQRLSVHFHVPSLIQFDGSGTWITGAPELHVIPYSRLSLAKFTTRLDELKPDLIIADEAHRLKHRETAGTSRVLRYLASHPETRLCCWSGTLTSRSIKDYGHLSAFALKESSPLPIEPNVLEDWSLAIDPSDWPAPMGALIKLCQNGETIHQGFYRRLTQTRGVVATKAGAVDASIVISERPAPTMPAIVKAELKNLRESWTRPDGEELVDQMSVARSARELACGFYYRWIFPRGESRDLIDAWFKARKAWHQELREKLRRRAEHLDSELLCTNAARRAYQNYEGDLPVWRADSWPAWLEVRDRVYHESEAVWLDDYLANDAAEWARKNKGVVWYEHNAFGQRVAQIASLPQHAGGPNAEAEILKERGDRSVIASIKAHGIGRDGLQKLFASQLVANPPSSGSTFEQLLGRLHRIGQAADEVTTYVYRHTAELKDAIDGAIKQARYIQDTLGTQQKLLLATYDWEET